MSKQNPLELYTQKGLELRRFREKNKKVLSVFDSLLVEMNSAETDLRNYAREQRRNLKNKFVKVIFSPAFKKYYDVAFLFKNATPKVKKILETKCIERKINKKIFDRLVENGSVPEKLKVDSFREDEQLPRITIKENYNGYDSKENNQ